MKQQESLEEELLLKQCKETRDIMYNDLVALGISIEAPANELTVRQLWRIAVEALINRL